MQGINTAMWIQRVALVCLVSLAAIPMSFSQAEGTKGVPDGVGIDEKLGAALSVDNLQFQDDRAQTVTLKTINQSKDPILFALVYYECPNLCTLVLNGMFEGLKGLKQLDPKLGAKIQVVALTINPEEKPELAATKKKAYLEQYGLSEMQDRVHFLTGSKENIDKISDQVGFRFKYVKEEGQYAHTSAIYAITPEGKLSRYLYGIQYPAKDLKFALLEASNGRIGNVIDRILLFCYRYDPVQRKYSMVLSKVMQAGSAGTVLIFGGYLALFWSRQRNRKERELQ